MSSTPSTPSTPSTAPATPGLSAGQYAQSWCNLLMREPDACASGVQTATQALASGNAPADVVNMCSNWGVSDIPAGQSEYGATEGFRYGCYLTAAFNGDVNNLCQVTVPDSNGGPGSTMPFVCPKTCNSIFGSNSAAAQKCSNNVQSVFDTLIDGRNRCTLNEDFSCIYGLNAQNSQYNCDTNDQDRKNHCVPTVVGCTMGKVQSQMLYMAQKYEKDNGLQALSCLPYTTQGSSSNPTGPDTPSPMFPDGNVYGPAQNYT
jgi:hypothetical protein